MKNVAVAVLLLLAANAHGRESTLDLSASPCFSEAIGQLPLTVEPPKIRFVDDSLLAVVASCPATDATASLHVLFVSRIENKVLHEISFSAKEVEVAPLPSTYGAAFGIVADNRLLTYSHRFEKLRERNLPTGDATDPRERSRWRVHSGTSIAYLSHFIHESESVFQLGPSLQLLDVAAFRRSELWSASDDAFVWFWFPDDVVAEKELRLTTQGKTSRLCRCRPTSGFIVRTGKQELVAAAFRKEIQLFDLKTGTLTKRIKISLAETALGAGSTLLLASDQNRSLSLSVVDLQSLHVHTLAEVPTWESTGVRGGIKVSTSVQPQIAISPSGQVIAALTGHAVTFYSANN